MSIISLVLSIVSLAFNLIILGLDCRTKRKALVAGLAAAAPPEGKGDEISRAVSNPMYTSPEGEEVEYLDVASTANSSL